MVYHKITLVFNIHHNTYKLFFSKRKPCLITFMISKKLQLSSKHKDPLRFFDEYIHSEKEKFISQSKWKYSWTFIIIGSHIHFTMSHLVNKWCMYIVLLLFKLTITISENGFYAIKTIFSCFEYSLNHILSFNVF